jgi:peroxiredoxin
MELQTIIPVEMKDLNVTFSFIPEIDNSFCQTPVKLDFNNICTELGCCTVAHLKDFLN